MGFVRNKLENYWVYVWPVYDLKSLSFINDFWHNNINVNFVSSSL